jgi:hypothetical protein
MSAARLGAAEQRRGCPVAAGASPTGTPQGTSRSAASEDHRVLPARSRVWAGCSVWRGCRRWPRAAVLPISASRRSSSLSSSVDGGHEHCPETAQNSIHLRHLGLLCSSPLRREMGSLHWLEPCGAPEAVPARQAACPPVVPPSGLRYSNLALKLPLKVILAAGGPDRHAGQSLSSTVGD